MTLREELDQLPDGYVLHVVSTTFEHRLTGVSTARLLKDGTIEVTYTDGVTESRPADASVLDGEDIGVIELTDFVQAGRNP